PNDFEHVILRITKVKGLDSRSFFVPLRQCLRCRRDVLDPSLAKTLIGQIHIADDDGDVLKPMISAARIRWNRQTRVPEMLSQGHSLVSELQFRRPNLSTLQPEQIIVSFATGRRQAHHLEGQNMSVEGYFPIKVGYGQANRADFRDCGVELE